MHRVLLFQCLWWKAKRRVFELALPATSVPRLQRFAFATSRNSWGRRICRNGAGNEGQWGMLGVKEMPPLITSRCDVHTLGVKLRSPWDSAWIGHGPCRHYLTRWCDVHTRRAAAAIRA
ncbi:hypothetical protein T440DRAFT_279661 [Plenodomus tracheiphilus IPT5]|uniref:Uncharacterized protein n=1 Tax=Plenodomus tracheiphilus IPT5 TaxID=1408161 RepID=A0A6A7ASP9_9PLEO|nr:hypothetical protein T440DRAFT_279661 [Plenodomus tracheiphilus IPT5]